MKHKGFIDAFGCWWDISG